jgi:hypothetical protein
MNTTIMAERQAKALATIREQTERLGGRLEMPTGPAPNPQVKFTLLLEAVAKALDGLMAPGEVTETATVVEQPAAPKAADEPKSAPKAKQAKGA